MLRFAFALLFALVAGAASANPSMVVDVQTGRVLQAERQYERWHPASLTKLMTALIAFQEIEAGRLTPKSPVRISLEAARKPPSHMATAACASLGCENECGNPATSASNASAPSATSMVDVTA